MRGDVFEARDVFWAPDPYNTGNDPRPWLVLAADHIPYAGEEYVCAALTLSDLPENVAVSSDVWVAGNDPTTTSYCSPWVLATIKHDAVTAAQGYVTDSFVAGLVQQSIEFLSGDVDVEE